MTATEFYASPLGQSLLKREEAVSRFSFQDYLTFQAYHKGYEQIFPSRYALYEEITALMPTQSMPVLRQVARAALSPFSDDASLAIQLDQLMLVYEQWQPSGRLIQTMMVYEGFSESEIRDALAFLKSPTGEAVVAVDEKLQKYTLKSGLSVPGTQFASRVKSSKASVD